MGGLANRYLAIAAPSFNMLHNRDHNFVLNLAMSNISYKELSFIKKILNYGPNFLFKNSEDIGKGFIEILLDNASLFPIIQNKINFIQTDSVSENYQFLDILNKYQIFVIPADKNLGFVILNALIYKQGVFNILNDSSTYKTLRFDQINLINSSAQSQCEKICLI
jgi:hypothetical protein